MSFVQELDHLPFEELEAAALASNDDSVSRALSRSALGGLDLHDFAALISPAAGKRLEELARVAHALTVQRFGRTIQLFAPLYVSNECVSTCAYCGFSRPNQVSRLTLSPKDVLEEARLLLGQGFRHILLVSGDHPKKVSTSYLEEVIGLLHPIVPSISLEVATFPEEDYRRLASAGVEGVVVYQETYKRDTYSAVHLKGPKRNFQWRLDTPERAARAGMRRIGIGVLLGLANWMRDALALVAHARYLMRRCWQSFLTVSVPRLRPAAGGFVPLHSIGDREFVQLVCSLRLALPEAGIVLSTRERPELRDGLLRLGVTHMSAGSRTMPGGYKGQVYAEPQFELEDHRTPAEVAERVRALGYDPVWKDWEAVLHGYDHC